MNFKVGQKVRVIDWVDMPKNVKDCYCKNYQKIGDVGTIINIPESVFHMSFYDVIFEGEIYPRGFFEKEIELSISRVGEQLLFSFMED